MCYLSIQNINEFKYFNINELKRLQQQQQIKHQFMILEMVSHGANGVVLWAKLYDPLYETTT